MFDRAAMNTAAEIQRKRFEGTPADPALFDPKQWNRADLIDGLRNAAQELLPAAPTRQNIATIRERVRQAVTKHGIGFTYEVFRLARSEGRLPAYWNAPEDVRSEAAANESMMQSIASMTTAPAANWRSRRKVIPVITKEPEPMSIKPEDLVHGHYYACDVALSPLTPIVRAVASEAQPGNVLIMLTGPGFQGRFDMRSLAHLEVLEEIEALAPENNTGKMPEPPKLEPVPAEPASDAKSEPAEAEAR